MAAVILGGHATLRDRLTFACDRRHACRPGTASVERLVPLAERVPADGLWYLIAGDPTNPDYSWPYFARRSASEPAN